MLLPGRNTIPDQIVDNRTPYFDALEDADKNETAGRIDLTKMEEFIESMLAKQLMGVMESATGQKILENPGASELHV